MKALKGFISLTATAFLVLLAAWAGVIALQIQSTSWAAKRSQAKSETRENLKEEADKLLKVIVQWDQEKQTWEDFVRELPGVKDGVDHNSRINLNWMNRFILGESALVSLFTGGSAEMLQQQRIAAGPAYRLNQYKDYFTEESLKNFFTVETPLNLNSADEFMVEMTGNMRECSGGIYRDKIRNLRLAKLQLKQEDLSSFLGPDQEKLTPFWTVQGDLNVNSCVPLVLSALITYPAWQIPDAAEKVQSLLELRKGRMLKNEELPGLLGVSGNHLVLGYLSDKSSVVEATLGTETPNLKVIFYVDPSQKGSGSVRILSQEFNL